MNQDPVKITNLLENLKSQDPKLKIESAKNLQVIAQAIGKDRARNELLPFIIGNFFF
jgi:hypothetical protein